MLLSTLVPCAADDACKGSAGSAASARDACTGRSQGALLHGMQQGRGVMHNCISTHLAAQLLPLLLPGPACLVTGPLQ